MPTSAAASAPDSTIRNHARTKILATIGPASSDRETLQRLVMAGADLFRLNMAHGTRQQHDAALRNVRAIEQDVNRPLGILVDLAGPKIRLGELPGGSVDCPADGRMRFVRGKTSRQPDQLVTNYPRLIDDLQEGSRILLADAAVQMIVETCTDDYAECRVIQAGRVLNRQGVNLPGVKLSVPAISDADRDAALWAVENDVNFVSLSFVRSPNDILELKQLLRDAGCDPLVIAKIEKAEAVDNLEAIVAVADGVMVARGDLGVEIDIADVPLTQKRIIQTCNRHNKPVIVATQMLASMQNSLYPTRAEVTDVANAVLDGTDACMLSGETAIGDYPCETVQMMNRIAIRAETEYHGHGRPKSNSPDDHVHAITQAVVNGAAQIAGELDASLVVVATRSGATALTLSKTRTYTPVIGISDNPSTLRKMSLYWGVMPLHGAPSKDIPSLKHFVSEWGKKDGCLVEGSTVVLVTGTGVTRGLHNAIEVHEVQDEV
ncbi:MAG: pyruvate kinase [Pirellulales bacterium]